MTTDSNIIAIVGRPNVGKSALFNRIVGRRVAIVHEEAGVTRDRVSARACWRDKSFEVVDTGGIAFLDEEKTADLLAGATRQQAEVAIALARVIIFMVDVSAGVMPLDLDIARKLRASGKPVFLAVNKVDNARREPAVAEFSRLGFDRSFPISAVHGLGVNTMLEAVTVEFPATTEAEPARPTRIAIVGRPNVGKSSLVNCLLKSERTIVSDIPGTTRDSIDVPFLIGNKPYALVDTAGLKHRSKIRTSVDQFGLMRAERSIRECDIAVLVLDARDGATQQDQKIGGQIAEAARACVILVNKWDLAAEQEQKAQRRKVTFRDQYLKALRKELFFLDWATVVFASAKTGERVSDLFGAIAQIERELTKEIGTSELNQVLGRAVNSYPPPHVGGKRFKVFYAVQRTPRPPTFTLFVNDPKTLTPHYQRYLADKLRAVWGFTGVPVILECRARERRVLKKIASNAR
jgi:GTP-binding protein